MKLDVDLLKNSVQTPRNIRVPEPDDAITLFLEPLLSLKISHSRFIIIVVPAIDFDDETSCGTKEVDDVWPDWRLSSKMRPNLGNLFKSPP